MKKNKFNSIFVKKSNEIKRENEMKNASTHIREKITFINNSDFEFRKNNFLKSVINLILFVLRAFLVLLIAVIVLLLITCIVREDIRNEFLNVWEIYCNKIIYLIREFAG